MEINNYRAGVISAVLKLFNIASKANIESELYPDITDSESELIKLYAKDKGLDEFVVEALQNILFSHPKLREQTLESRLVKGELANHALEAQLPLRNIKKYAKIAFGKNQRLDPEELRILEGILSLEGHIKGSDYEQFDKLIAPYNQDRKLCLMIHGQDEAIDLLLQNFKDSRFETTKLRVDLTEDGKHQIEDKNHQGRVNMIVFAPYSYIPEHKKIIITNFYKADNMGLHIPRIAIYTKKGDKPTDFNVDMVVPETAKFPQIVESISDLYRRFYLRGQK
ncbi:hypothetical protein J4404_02460 [Candidatus Woesearchaeota archaeon]|nr:hypothetical protein [Candidatus Woesearchaeota archaeon]